jgi:hypothetical protein
LNALQCAHAISGRKKLSVFSPILFARQRGAIKRAGEWASAVRHRVETAYLSARFEPATQTIGSQFGTVADRLMLFRNG